MNKDIDHTGALIKAHRLYPYYYLFIYLFIAEKGYLLNRNMFGLETLESSVFSEELEKNMYIYVTELSR